MWLFDAVGTFADSLVDLVFDDGFSVALTASSIDVTGYAPASLRIYDALGETLLLSVLTLTKDALSDSPNYARYSVLSGTGIGGFSFSPASHKTIEGRTSIDNVSVTTMEDARRRALVPTPVPEPASMLLLVTGFAGLAARYRRGRTSKAGA
ncbi:MAG: PEP-CTERM sorting domain-containing protein [Vicinamibacterales bacterium]